MNFFIEFLLLSLIVISFDYIYLTANSKYFSYTMATIQKSSFKLNYIGAILAYICIVLLIYIFVFMNNLSSQHAFLLGFLTYGVYHGTNLACFEKWPYYLVVSDSIWGGILFASSSYIMNFILEK